MGWESNSVFQVLIVQGSTGSGIFVYSPSPALGNLVGTITAAGGTDQYGNAYLPGITDYLPSSVLAIQMSAGALTFYTAPSVSGPWTAGASLTVTTGVLNLTGGAGGHVNVVQELTVGGGLTVSGGTADQVALTGALAAAVLLDLTNTTSDTSAMIRETVAAVNNAFLACRVSGDTQNRIALTTTAAGLPQISLSNGTLAPDTFINRNTGKDLVLNPGRDVQVQSPLALNAIAAPTALAGNIVIYGDTAGQPAYINPQSLQMQVSGAELVTFPNITATAATPTVIATFTIPAADMVAGALYELEVHGHGTQGSTQQGVAFAVTVGGTGIGVAPQSGSAFAAASQAFRWKSTALLACHTAGAAGTMQTSVNSTLTQNTGASNSETIEGGTSGDTTINTTASQAFAITAAWGATTGAPTLTSDFATFKRVA